MPEFNPFYTECLSLPAGRDTCPKPTQSTHFLSQIDSIVSKLSQNCPILTTRPNKDRTSPLRSARIHQNHLRAATNKTQGYFLVIDNYILYEKCSTPQIQFISFANQFYIGSYYICSNIFLGSVKLQYTIIISCDACFSTFSNNPYNRSHYRYI